jgi:hypothetical protein
MKTAWQYNRTPASRKIAIWRMAQRRLPREGGELMFLDFREKFIGINNWPSGT